MDDGASTGGDDRRVVESFESPDWRALQRRHERLLADDGWDTVLDRRRVRAAILVLNDHPVPAVRADVSLACSPRRLARFLVDDILQTLPEWNPVFGGGEVVEALAEGERVLRLVNDLPWPLRKREDLFYNAKKQLDDGTIVELSVGVEHPSAPQRDDMIRSQMHLATKRMVPRDDGGCDYTAMWHYDLRGWMAAMMPRRMLAKAVANDLAKECDRLRARFGEPRPNSV